MPDCMVVDSGLDILTSLLVNHGPKHIHWGTGDTPPSPSDTDLEIPRGEEKVEGVATQQTIERTNDAFDVVGTLFAEGTPAVITEAGLFLRDGETDSIFSRVTFDPLSIAVEDGLQLTFRVRFADAS